MIEFSEKALKIKPFEVMQILAKAQEMERRGEKVIHLEIGEPDFDTPKCIRDEAIKAMERGFTHYSDSKGVLELREALADHVGDFSSLSIDPNKNILVTGGVSLGLLFALSTITNPGDEVMITDPTYPCYENFVKYVDAVPIGIEVYEEDDFKLDIDNLERAISEKTKAILLNSPSNPTGMFFELSELEEVVEIASKKGIYVIVDEIYSGLVYDRKRSPSILETGYGNAIMLDGFSKLYAMTGWRLGYAISNVEVIQQMLKLQQNFYICPSPFAQIAAIKALCEAEEDVKKMVEEFDKRRKFIVEKINEIKGFKTREPKGAYYVFTNVKTISDDSTELANFILDEAKVAVAPGVSFGSNGEGYLRFSYANSIENIAEGVERIRMALNKFRG
ncbi:MAG: pyridoxal phosphate-dependent aminotransferase [Candidatus Hydrothermarchaeales archaeon]